ncbi:DUF551 domain-containing protein [Erwinia pyrifoliae]|uniref:DUF551 domain-containing protein n=1 Tax=Erwinia pyrifoliae TaxID=79967 RepID=UPI0035CD2D3E
MKKLRLMSSQRIKEISTGATPVMGEKEQLAVTALHYIGELNLAHSAFRDTGLQLLAAEKRLEGWEEKSKPYSVTQQLPEPNNTVLLYDASGEGWVIGWRSVWRTSGQKETGNWEWSFQITELNSENTHITHWAPVPNTPQMETL